MATIPNKINLNPEMGRWYALIVLIVVFVLVYFLFFQSFFSEHALLNEEIADLEESRKEYMELRVLIPELQNRINQVKETVGDNTNFLTEDNYNLGTAELTRLLKRIVSNNVETQSQCSLSNQTPSKDKEPDQFEKIILKVRMRCQYDRLVKVFNGIETSVPNLFMDNLTVDQRRISRRSRRNVKPTAPMLDVRFDLYAYMNKPVKVKNNDKK
jgi:general secretion pathway protein M